MWAGRAALGAAVLVGALLGVPEAADADPPLFTWSGASEVATGDARMSTPGNWAGGVAPARGRAAALVFPSLACVADGSCDRVVNDVPGLVASSIALTQRTIEPGAYVQTGSYALAGEELALSGPLTTAVDRVSRHGQVYPAELLLPLRLVGGTSTWRLDRVGVAVRSAVTGASLEVVATRRAGVEVEGRGRVLVERYVEKGDGSTLSSVYLGRLGDRGGSAVDLRRTGVLLTGATLGSLTTSRVAVELAQSFPRQSRVSTVLGDVRLDPGSSLALSEVTRRHASLSVGGTVQLGGAQLLPLLSDCRDTVPGTPLVLVRAAEVTGIFSDSRGRPVPDGAVVRAPANDYCSGTTRLRVDYSPTRVTLTALDPVY